FSSPHPALNLLLHSFPTRRSSDLDVIRNIRTVRLLFGFLRSTVSNPSHCFNVIPVQFMTQIFYMAVNHSAITVKVITPQTGQQRDRKSTRLNSSHVSISYAVFCLK